jgi:hypothetical protein
VQEAPSSYSPHLAPIGDSLNTDEGQWEGAPALSQTLTPVTSTQVVQPGLTPNLEIV